MISIHARQYRGKDSKRLNQYHSDIQAADALQKFMNHEKEKAGGEPVMMDYFTIAQDTGLTKETVKRILDHNGYGANGATW